MTLKEKFKEKMSKFKLPSRLSPEDRYRLALEMHPPKFPRLPTSELALAWFPPYPWWLTCKEMFKYKSQKKLKPSETVTWAYHWLHNYPGHLRYDLSAMSIISNQGAGANTWEIPKYFLLSLFLTFHLNCFNFQPSGSRLLLRRLRKEVVLNKPSKLMTPCLKQFQQLLLQQQHQQE